MKIRSTVGCVIALIILNMYVRSQCFLVLENKLESADLTNIYVKFKSGGVESSQTSIQTQGPTKTKRCFELNFGFFSFFKADHWILKPQIANEGSLCTYEIHRENCPDLTARTPDVYRLFKNYIELLRKYDEIFGDKEVDPEIEAKNDALNKLKSGFKLTLDRVTATQTDGKTQKFVI